MTTFDSRCRRWLALSRKIGPEHGLWVHADAAYGGLFRLLEEGESLIPGLELCDSVTLDPHKGPFLPYATGCLLVRDGAALYRTYRSSADYLQDVSAPSPTPPAQLISPISRRNCRASSGA